MDGLSSHFVQTINLSEAEFRIGVSRMKTADSTDGVLVVLICSRDTNDAVRLSSYTVQANDSLGAVLTATMSPSESEDSDFRAITFRLRESALRMVTVEANFFSVTPTGSRILWKTEVIDFAQVPDRGRKKQIPFDAPISSLRCAEL
jgi:hypothetical protein